ncbi:pyridoxamine 5'-phosphate oxidase family protein [Rubrobacter tropicus]|uniref:Pyridoxamine 5'-phosphate oxidase family protein n=1 Tax=Rubrobacter tropicus TaxID=2653851 RepID=A0A6G8QEJ2_9ACTN|nr:pyridoxamine 5'-phosphate oxidase family protein [Rubrobacter tropicus]QIN84910.1 pyridoxamine 5'-phosphate oxidase family protein [Rubrobacter tropicus]
MKETPRDFERLQALLDRSVEGAGDFLRASFGMPEHSLSAVQLARLLQGTQTVALATVTRGGEPRVAPTGALFYRGRFHVPTVATAARTRHLLERPAVSLTLYGENDLAIIAHGRAEVLGRDHPEFPPLEDAFREPGGGSVLDWGEGVYLRVEAEKTFTFARYPERFGG